MKRNRPSHPPDWDDSPWARARRRRSPLTRLFGKGAVLALTAGFAWVLFAITTSGPGSPVRARPSSGQVARGTPLPAKWKDRSGEQAAAFLSGVQQGRSQGKVYGIVDGSVAPLTGDEAAGKIRAHRIKEALRSLRSEYLSAKALRESGSAKVQPAEIDRMIADAKGRAVKALQAHPAGAIRQEMEAFERFLGTDPEVRDLFGEVANATRR